MSTKIRFAAMLLALISMLAFSAGSASAQAGGCDTTGTINGTATPTFGTIGTRITVNATGFTVGEDVSFWFTLPNGIVVGTAQPIPNGVNPDGSVGPLPFTIDQQDVNLGTGRWAVTFEGATSHHQAIIYFCVLTVAQATAVAQPTSTPVPAAPTATSVPPTAVPPTETAVPATAVATAVATEVLPTATTEVAATATTEVAATAVPAVPTVPVAPTATTEVLPLPTAVTPGMPTTGQPANPWLAPVLFLLATSILALGLLVRRTSRSRMR